MSFCIAPNLPLIARTALLKGLFWHLPCTAQAANGASKSYQISCLLLDSLRLPMSMRLRCCCHLRKECTRLNSLRSLLCMLSAKGKRTVSCLHGLSLMHTLWTVQISCLTLYGDVWPHAQKARTVLLCPCRELPSACFW